MGAGDLIYQEDVSISSIEKKKMIIINLSSQGGGGLNVFSFLKNYGLNTK